MPEEKSSSKLSNHGRRLSEHISMWGDSWDFPSGAVMDPPFSFNYCRGSKSLGQTKVKTWYQLG